LDLPLTGRLRRVAVALQGEPLDTDIGILAKVLAQGGHGSGFALKGVGFRADAKGGSGRYVSLPLVNGVRQLMRQNMGRGWLLAQHHVAPHRIGVGPD